MKKPAILLSILIIAAILINSCKTRITEEPIEVVFSTHSTDTAASAVPNEKREIFYGLLSPVEISNIFARLGAQYDKDILNPPSTGGDYLSSSKAALNLGVYGVDLSYVKMFDLNAEMIGYMLVVRNLSRKLDIPEKYLTDPIEQMENDMDNSDEVLSYVNTAYKRIEDHLEVDGRESTAGLMVLGGWIEALYIATEMLLDVENPDPEIVERIAEQKYTLNTLLSFLKNYYDDPIVVYYTKKLKFLKKYFDKYDIYFRTDDLEIDRDKQVLKASGSDMTITKEILLDIKDYVRKMRMETIGLN